MRCGLPRVARNSTSTIIVPENAGRVAGFGNRHEPEDPWTGPCTDFTAGGSHARRLQFRVLLDYHALLAQRGYADVSEHPARKRDQFGLSTVNDARRRRLLPMDLTAVRSRSHQCCA